MNLQLLLQAIRYPLKKVEAIHRTSTGHLVWIGLTIVGVTFIIYKVVKEWQQIYIIPWHLTPGYIVLSFSIYSVNLLLTASCWALIIAHFTGNRNFWHHVRIFCSTNLAQRLPTPFPYLAARAKVYASYGIYYEVTLTAMTVEIAVTIISAAIISIVTSALRAHAFSNIGVNLPLMVFLIFPLVPVVIPAKFISIVNLLLVRLGRPSLSSQLTIRQTLLWVGIFGVIWVNSGVLYYFVVSIITTISPEKLIFLTNVSAVSGLFGWMGQILFFLPIPAVRQFAIIYLMNLEFPMPVALALALFSRLIVMIFELVWAGAWLFIHILRKMFSKNKEGGI